MTRALLFSGRYFNVLFCWNGGLFLDLYCTCMCSPCTLGSVELLLYGAPVPFRFRKKTAVPFFTRYVSAMHKRFRFTDSVVGNGK